MIKIANNIHRLLEKQAADKEDSLHDWFSRKGAKGSEGGWVDCNSPDGSGGYKTCGREKGESRSKYPACRPTAAACKDKGKGDSWGKKSEEEKDKADDACTRKVKARYDVWPSAYASGAVTRCRAVGAANWGEGKSKKEKKKTEKKAYGAADIHREDERWLASGAPWTESPADAAELTRRFQEEAAKQNLKLMFSSKRYNPEGELTPEQAIKAIQSAKSDRDEGLPYFYILQSQEADGVPIDYANHPLNNLDFNSSKKQANTLGSGSIVDVPIKCTPGFGCKRNLTLDEMLEIEAAKERMFPSPLITDADPVSAQMSSPGWAGAGYGALGALLGAGVGAGAGKLTNSNIPLSALLGGTIGGLGAGLYGYGSKVLKNKKLEDLIENLPVGANIGDVEVFSDPKLKAQLARDLQRQLIRKGLMNQPGLGYQ